MGNVSNLSRGLQWTALLSEGVPSRQWWKVVLSCQVPFVRFKWILHLPRLLWVRLKGGMFHAMQHRSLQCW